MRTDPSFLSPHRSRLERHKLSLPTWYLTSHSFLVQEEVKRGISTQGYTYYIRNDVEMREGTRLQSRLSHSTKLETSLNYHIRATSETT